MRDLRRLWSRLGDERGVSLALLAVGAAVFIGMAAIAIDLGMLMAAKTDAQRVADAAAHSGAVRLAQLASSPKTTREDAARLAAQQTAEDNTILGKEYTDLRDGEVTFPEDHKVRVRVYRNPDREDGPLGTFFARILGIDAVDLAVDATAAVFVGGAAECTLPIALPDRWTEDEGNYGEAYWPTLEDTFDPEDTDDTGTDDYISWQQAKEDNLTNYTGYDNESYGFQVKLRVAGSGTGEFNPSWYGVWRHPDGSGSGSESGTNDYREAITGEACEDRDRIVKRGDEVDTEPGNFPEPTKRAFEELISQDEDAEWDATQSCVTRGDGCVEDSPRIRALPLFDPTLIPDPGSKPFRITNFMSIFVEEVDRTNDLVIGRLLGLTGFESTGEPGVGEDVPGIKAIQIIE